MRYTLLWLVMLPLSILGQTGLIENFNDNLLDAGWKSVPGAVFTLKEENEELKVEAVNAGSGWSNLEFSFRTQNISANPVIQLKIKNEQSFILRVDVVDIDGLSNNNQSFSKTVEASGEYVNHLLDFSGKFGNANSNQISKIVIFINPGAHPGFTGTLYIDDLIIGDALPYMTNGPIRVNQVGYELKGPKTAILERNSEDFTVSTFELINQQGEIVHSGDLVSNGSVPGWSGRYFWTADFSSFQESGSYAVKIGSIRSHMFEIQDNLLFNTTIEDAINFFTGMRSTHAGDRSLSFNGTRSGTANVYGGWWDANGDPGKHLSHLSYANYFNPQQIPMVVWSLLKSYELSEAAFSDYSERLLEEAAWGADYLLRNLDPEGYFYMAIFDEWGNAPWSREICEWGAPGDNAARSPNYQASFRQGGGISIAALARAYHMNLTSGDSSATHYLQGAIKAYAHLKSPGQGYATKNLQYANNHEENIIDDYCALLAATELFKATGQNEYLSDARLRARNLLNRLNAEGWLQSDNAGTRPFYHAADEGLPIVALIDYMDIDQDLNNEIVHFLNKSIEWYLTISEEIENPFKYLRQYQRSFTNNNYGPFKKAFFVPHNNETGYWWQGENARIASLSTAFLMAARKINVSYEPGHDAITQYAINQIDWILGKNPFEVCMLYGYGYKNYPDYPSGAGMANIKGGICNGISADDNNENNLAWKPFADNNWENWRWIEQWLPHNAWYVLALSTFNNLLATPADAVSEFGVVSAFASATNVVIEWSTLSEANGRYFEIQKSLDGEPFETIGQIPATGAIGTPAEYTFSDTDFDEASSPLYRIVLVDQHSKRLVSESVTIVVTSTLERTSAILNIFPNPFTTSTRIDLQYLNLESPTLKISSIAGKMIQEFNPEGKASILIGEDLSPGVYLIELKDNNTKINGRIIKTH